MTPEQPIDLTQFAAVSYVYREPPRYPSPPIAEIVACAACGGTFAHSPIGSSSFPWECPHCILRNMLLGAS